MAKSAAIDLYGVQVDLDLEINGKVGSFKSFAGTAVDYIDSISIDIGMLENIRIEVKIVPPIDVGIRLLKSGIIGMGFQVKKQTDSTKTPGSIGSSVGVGIPKINLNKVMLRIHYGGLNSPQFKGYLMMPEFSLSDAGMEITLHGIGMLFDQTQKIAAFAGKNTPLQLIEQIFKTDNLQLDISDAAKNRLSKPQAIVYTAKKNHLEVLKDLCSTYGCRFVVVGNKSSKSVNKQIIQIRTVEETRNSKNIVATFVAFKNIDPNNAIYPILSMNAPLSNVLIGNILSKNLHVTFDRKTGEAKEAPHSYEQTRTSQAVSSDGSVGLADDKGQSNSAGEPGPIDGAESLFGSLIGTVTRAEADMVDKISGSINNYLEKAFEFNLTSVCIPNLLPARLANISVADIPTFNNTFDIFKVRHTIANGGAETSVEMKAMAGLASTAAQQINRVVGKATDKAADLLGQNSTKTPSSTGLIK